MLLPLVLGLGVGLATATAVAAPLKPKDAKARKHFDAAVDLYNKKDFDASAEAATKGLEIEEHESLLFILAQAERQRDNCVAAVEIFTRFIELTESDDMRQNALTAKAICAEELAEQARQAELEAQLAAEIEEEEEPEPEPAPAPAESTKPWYRDPLGGVLVGVGGAGLLGGGALLITAAVLDPDKAVDYGTFAQRRRIRPRLLIAGGATAGAGLLIAGAGALRWGLLAKKAKNPPADPQTARRRIDVAPWVIGGTGVTISGRF